MTTYEQSRGAIEQAVESAVADWNELDADDRYLDSLDTRLPVGVLPILDWGWSK